MPILLNIRRKHPRLKAGWVRAFCRKLLIELNHGEAELSVSLVGDPEIQAINAQWRNRDKPTDVLSFSQLEGDVPWPVEGAGAQAMPSAVVLGDIIISLDTAKRQADGYGHSLEVEVSRLLIHGAAHLLGHDHVHGGAQAERMYRLEERLMRALDIPLKP